MVNAEGESQQTNDLGIDFIVYSSGAWKRGEKEGKFMRPGLIPRFVRIPVAGGLTESLLAASWSRATIPAITGCYWSLR